MTLQLFLQPGTRKQVQENHAGGTSETKEINYLKSSESRSLDHVPTVKHGGAKHKVDGIPKEEI